MTHDTFTSVVHKWHRIISESVVQCLKSGEYMQMKNAVNVLNAINGWFPKIDKYGALVLEAVTQVKNVETRGDLKLNLTRCAPFAL